MIRLPHDPVDQFVLGGAGHFLNPQAHPLFKYPRGSSAFDPKQTVELSEYACRVDEQDAVGVAVFWCNKLLHKIKMSGS